MGFMGVAGTLKSANQDAIQKELYDFKHYVPICNHWYLFSIKYYEKYTRSVI